MVNAVLQPGDVLIQASSTAESEAWHLVQRSAGRIGPQAWMQALSVARRIARHEKVDIYRAEAASAPTLYETYGP